MVGGLHRLRQSARPIRSIASLPSIFLDLGSLDRRRESVPKSRRAAIYPREADRHLGVDRCAGLWVEAQQLFRVVTTAVSGCRITHT